MVELRTSTSLGPPDGDKSGPPARTKIISRWNTQTLWGLYSNILRVHGPQREDLESCDELITRFDKIRVRMH